MNVLYNLLPKNTKFETIENRRIYAFVKFENLVVYEGCEKNLKEHLINRYETDLPNRKLHESAENCPFIVKVFYNQIGYVDISYGLANKIKNKFGLRINLIRERNHWKKRKPVSIKIF